MAKDMSLDELLRKGGGVLKRHGDVWSYPGAIVDTSGTNLRMPLNYVTDAEVRQALADGKLQASVTDVYGRVNSVRAIDASAKVVTTALAGSAEMGTELPVGARVEHDAGRQSISAEEAEAATRAGMATVSPVAKAEVEGGERVSAPIPASVPKSAAPAK